MELVDPSQNPSHAETPVDASQVAEAQLVSATRTWGVPSRERRIASKLPSLVRTSDVVGGLQPHQLQSAQPCVAAASFPPKLDPATLIEQSPRCCARLRSCRKLHPQQPRFSPRRESPKKKCNSRLNPMKPKPEDITEWLKVIVPQSPAILKEVRLAIVALACIFAFTVVVLWKGPEVAVYLSGFVASAKSLFR